jgi:hypothetical protein
MALQYASEDEVELLTRDELADAIELTVRSTGFSLEELEDQAERGEFESERARLTWAVVLDERRAADR